MLILMLKEWFKENKQILFLFITFIGFIILYFISYYFYYKKTFNEKVIFYK